MTLLILATVLVALVIAIRSRREAKRARRESMRQRAETQRIALAEAKRAREADLMWKRQHVPGFTK